MIKNNIAIFASGSGTNAERIIEYFEKNEHSKVVLVMCNKPNAYVVKRAEKKNIYCHVFNSESFKKNDDILSVMQKFEVKWIVLAGFLLKVPAYIINNFTNRIVNIHPSLLPNYGGKGMYGMNVHRAVINNNESKSGITIHHVSEEYDEGNVIFQAQCTVSELDTAEELAKKVQTLEHQHYAKVIDRLIQDSEL